MLLLIAVAHAVVKLAWLCFAHAISETVEKKSAENSSCNRLACPPSRELRSKWNSYT